MKTREKRDEIERLEDLLRKVGRYLDEYCWQYAEPGYTKDNEEGYILFANWNDVNKHLMKYIEKHHNIEWSDEWSTCNHCKSAFRISGDSWGWTMYGSAIDCELWCGDCIKDDPEPYIETISNSPKRCDTIGIDLKSIGFKQLSDSSFQSGMYGINDNPDVILQKIQASHPYLDIVFGNITAGQFAIDYEVFGRVNEDRIHDLTPEQKHDMAKFIASDGISISCL